MFVSFQHTHTNLKWIIEINDGTYVATPLSDRFIYNFGKKKLRDKSEVKIKEKTRDLKLSASVRVGSELF